LPVLDKKSIFNLLDKENTSMDGYVLFGIPGHKVLKTKIVTEANDK